MSPDHLSDTLDLSAEQLRLLELLLEEEGVVTSDEDAIPRRVEPGPAPLSSSQRRLWFEHRLDPESAAYNVPMALRLRGPADVSLLERCLTEVVRRHEALRTVFEERDGEPVQVVRAAEPVAVPVTDFSHLPVSERSAAVRWAVQEEATRPFDLARGPLVRAALLRLAAGEHVLLFSLHHIVSDEWSTAVLVREVAALYGAFARGESSPLPPLPVQYADYAAWQHDRVNGGTLERQLAYWREALDGIPASLELPTDRSRAALPGAAAGSMRFALSPEASAALRALAVAEGATLFAVLLAGWQALLALWSGQDDVSVGTPVANRTRPELEGLIGFFANTLVMRADLSDDPTVRELVGRVRATVVAGQEHQDVPFERVVEIMGSGRIRGGAPRLPVLFTLHDPLPADALRLGAVTVEPLEPEVAEVQADLVLELVDRKPAITGRMDYRTELWDAGTMERMLTHYATLLEGMAADPERRLSSVEILGSAERARVLEMWSGSGRAEPVGGTLHERFAEQAARTPGAVALVFGEERLTYAELHVRSDALAGALRALGVGVETRVGICVERSPELVVGLLGILKAGGAYVPLDPQYPAERLAYMVADAGVRVLYVQPGLEARFEGFGGEVVMGPPHPPGPPPPASEGRGEYDTTEGEDHSAELPLPQQWGRVASLSEPGGGAVAPLPPAGEGLGRGPSPDSLAYVIYTSGSTGQPKGTEVPHRAIPGFFRGAEYARFGPGTVVLQHSSVSWDALTLELWPALLSGGTCVLYPGQTSEPGELGEQVRAHGVNTLWLTSAYFNLIVDTCPEVLSGVDQVLTGGEAVSAGHVRRAQAAHPGLRVVNGYGPSECTVFATCYPVPAGYAGETVPIGRPVGDRRVYVLDRHLGPAPEGVAGEVFVGGAAVARGYLGRPELTAERFVPDPYSGEPGARLYRTGDRGRWRSEGELEFVGRVDFQVKIRGFRVEPEEVEAVLAAHSEVREATVQVREDVPGEKRLVGYVVPSAETVSVAELRSYLKGRLPEYMVPSALVVLDALPLTSHGKVDRKALPAPEGADEAEYVAPRTLAEAALADVFAAVLGTGPVGAHSDFFALGGHSLLATRLVSRVREALGVELPLRSVFEAPTVAGLAALVETVSGEDAARTAPIVPVPRDAGGALPLSFAQRRLWFVHRMDPESPAYNVPAALRLRGPLDVEALRGSLAAVIRRHEALRTVFEERDDEPVQVIRDCADPCLRVTDLRTLPAAEREETAARLAREEALRPFDLEAGPLLRAGLLRLDEEDWVLLLTVHHVVSDGWSMGVLVREVSELYSATGEGRDPALPELPVQYADYAAWQHNRLSGEALERQLAWWREALRGAPPLLEVPTDRPRPPVQDGRGASRPFRVPARTVQGLRSLARAEGATPFMAVLAAWQALLSRWSGQEDVCVGTPVAGRTHAAVEPLIGFFVNTLVLRADLSGDPSFRTLLGRVRETALGAYAHQEVPFERLVEALHPERSLRHTPLFQAMFALQGAEPVPPRLGGLAVERLDDAGEVAKFDLDLQLVDDGEEMAGVLVFREALFDDATAERMLAHLGALLEQVVAEPDLPLARLSLADAGETARLRAWGEGAPAPAALPVHRGVAEQARRTPGATAVAWDGGTLTFAELDARANRLAHHLRGLGVGPETRVAVCMERGPELVVTLLAVLRAGGAYVPLDPGYPAARLAYMLADAGAPVLLAGERQLGALPDTGATVVCPDRDAALVAASPDTDPEVETDPASLAYLIYTSGSTGTPRAVGVPHGALANHMAWMQRAWPLAADDRVLQKTPVSFDASVWEFWAPLLAGATLVLAGPDAHRDPAALVRAVAERGITVLQLVPSLLREVLEAAGVERPGALRRLFCGGEALPAELAGRAREMFGAEVVNLYGPTETCIDATSHRYVGTEPGATVPVGRPVDGVTAYVLDARGEPAPAGVPGELWLGGAQVARGYPGRPELTAARFAPDPFSAEPGSRAYRTGDRVRWLATGELEFLGRLDGQAKVRGFRVEPAEVEAALREHPSVRDAAVTVWEAAPGDTRLAGYVVPADGEVPVAALREHLRARLPEPMVPGALVVLDALPRTPAGKLDRRALPAPQEGEGEAYVAPRTPAESRLAEIFAEVLRVEQVGAHDDFFALGGHSLLATRVTSRVLHVFGVELPVRALFEAPTVAGLAARLPAVSEPQSPEPQGAGGGTAALSPERRLLLQKLLAEKAEARRRSDEIRRVPRDRPLPLSYAQQRLWLIDRLQPGNPAYNIPSPLSLRGSLDVSALRRTLSEIARRHEALRTVLDEVDGEAVQVVLPARPFPLPVVELSGLAGDDREREVGRLAADDALRPFDLRRGPLFRGALLREDAEAWALLLTVHHVVSDGWSTGILVNEFSALYEAFSRGLPSPLPELRVQYGDFAAWQREWLAGERLEAQLAYWRGRLADAPPTLDLPTDHPRPAVPGPRGATHSFELSPEASRTVRELCRREGITPYMAFLAAWQLLLGRYAGVEDVSVGTGVAGRSRLETEGLVGFFVNTLVLRTDLSGRPDVREVLRRVREATLDAFAHQDVPFEKLVEELHPERSLHHAPLFQVMFTYQNTDQGEMKVGGLELDGLDRDAEAAKFDLSLSAWDQDDIFHGSLVYRPDLFEPETLAAMAEHLVVLLEGLAGSPDRSAAALPMMGTAERARVLEAAGGPPRGYPRDLCIHHLFERQAARTPDAVALAFDGGTLTYAELDREADRIARGLPAYGAGVGTRVGVFLERGPEWVASLLGVLKAGAVYVPLDPGNPAERTRYVLEDSGASLLLTSESLKGSLPEFGGKVFCVGASPPPPTPPPHAGEGSTTIPTLASSPPLVGEGWREAPGWGAAGPAVSPDHLAYVVYTSGSTGKPKAVPTAHGGVVHYLTFLADAYGVGPGDAVLQVATPTFDASIRDTLGPLTTGARLVLAPSGEVAEPRRLLDRARAHGVTAIMAVVPSVLRTLLAGAREGDEAPLRLLLVSGEALPVADARRARAVFGAGLRVVNQWGATECTMTSTLHEVADDEETPVAPVGVPIHNTRVHVLDPELEPVPFGVPGEAYIDSPGLTHGYAGRPESTAEMWVPDPLADQPGARMYRVGDRVRRRRDGVLEFLGRVDHQVKVQGVRVEPGEVEAALREHPAVGAAAVVAREERPGEARLVAYVVPAAGADSAVAELRAYLADRLPPYMVPSAWVRLDALPLLPNGKLDRSALPEAAADEVEYVEPRTATERAVAEIWAEVLGAERVGAEDDFFALGGHSLLATRMISRVRRAFGVELPLRALFEAPTVAGTAARLDAALGAGERADAPPLLPAPREPGGALPLSMAQQRIWFLQELDPGSAAYNMPHPLRLEGAPDVRALRRSLDALVARHETLRTVFARVEGEASQGVRPAARVPLPAVDLGGLPAAAREGELRRLAAEEALRPFDLARGPLLRALLVRAGAEEHALLFTLHHVIADGWSLGILVREVSALYAAFSAGREPGLPPLPVQYADFAVWQRAWLAGGALERQVDYWRGQLDGAPPLLELPTDRPRPAVQTEAGGRVTFELPAHLAEALDALSRREGVTLFMTLLAGWQAVLSRWSGQDDVSVGTPIAGRTRAEVEGLIGMFVNTLVLRTHLHDDPTFRALLARVRETTLGAYAHQDVPFERLVEALQPERSLRHTPLFQVSFALQNLADEELHLGSLRLAPLSGEEEAAKFDLSLVVSGDAERLGGMVSFRTELFDASTVERLLGRFRTMLEALASNPDLCVSEVDLLDAEERRAALAGWGDVGPVPAPERTIDALFTEQAERTPDAPALSFGGETLTYAELHRRADALARELAARGVGPDARVGLCTPRSAGMVVGMLAILRAGGAYVPLDPDYPAERLAFMVADAGVRVLVVQPGLEARFEGFDGEVVVELPLPPGPPPPASEGRGESDSTMPAVLPSLACGGGIGGGGPVTPEHLAYVIYTSGSTGRPKGVAVPHRGVVRLVRDADLVRFGPGERVAQVASASFDAATWEVWGALLNGGCLVGIERETALSPRGLAEALRRERVTAMFLTSALFTQTVREAPDAFATVEHLVVGGDAVDPGAARRCLEAGPPGRLLNGYGPTENTTFSTWHRIDAEAAGGATVPIGRAVAGSTAYVLDRWMAPVPEGTPGELYVGGWGVARGYLGRAELTAEKFVPDPYGPAGARLYRTGDRVRWNGRGEVEFLGRMDFQVKIRGFRVEPGEVEAELGSHPGVDAAVVVVREDETGGPVLVGYAAVGEGGPTGGELREWLKGRLPEYLVPAAVVVLEALPLTANGKVDRKALPAPDRVSGAGEHVPPRTPTEEKLAATFAEVLGAERVGATDDFFDLGGHSLLATRAISRVREAFGVEVPLRALFEAPTVAGLAERVDGLLRAEAATLAPAPTAAAPSAPADELSPARRELLRKLLGKRAEEKREAGRIRPRGSDGPAPLSFAQQRLWIIDQLQPGSPAYNVPAALRIRGPLDVVALERTLTEVVRRHEVLRSVVRPTEGGAVAVALPPAPAVIPVTDLSALPAVEREAAVLRLTADEAARPFDLARGPLLRAGLLRLGAAEHVLLFTLHHIVSDGWSMGVMVKEVSALYAAHTEGRVAQLPELPVQYGDFAAWQRSWLSGETLERQLAYWRGRLANAPGSLELPTDRPAPPTPGSHASNRRFTVSPGTVRRLRALGRSEGATPFMVFLAAWQVLLSRWSGQDDVVVGTPVAGRMRTEVEGLIGFFVNTLVIRSDLVAAPRFRALLRQVRDAVLEAQTHQDIPFEKLVEELHPDRDPRRTPFFRVMFTLQAFDEERLSLGPVTMEPLRAEAEAAKFDLTLTLVEGDGELSGRLAYRTELWDAATVDRMLEHYVTLLDAVAADGDGRVSTLPILPSWERAQVLEGLNDTRRDYPAGLRVHDLFAAQARRTSRAPALSHRGDTLSYADLDRRSARLAHHLRALGVGPESRVGVCLERTPDLVIALLAVLRAGGAYVPLDPAYPRERLGYMQEDAGVSLVLTSARLASVLPEGTRTLALDAARAEIEAHPDEAPESGVLPENLSHVIFTSGSTGRPKGVMIRHASTVVLLHWLRENVSDAERSSVLFSTSINFDVSVAEVFGTLSWGGKLVLVENALELATVEEPVVHVSMVPTAAAELLRAGAIPGSVRTLNLGGEPLPNDLAQGLYGLGTVEKVGNLYGPTEDTTYSTYSVVERGGSQVFVGRPVSNTQALVLDGELEPVPVGVVGELYLSGDGLSRGYAGRPDLTAERYLPNPYGAPGSRMYRVLDRIRWRPDGELEYFGRTDFQVKVRGYRIELGEIETALRTHGGVGEAVVVVREDEPGDRRIVAYVVGADGAAPDAGELRGHVQARVPEYMVPSAYVGLEALPRTLNGKIDRRALPAPDAPASDTGAYVAPRTPTEEVLAGIYAEVLGAERVGAHADFFELGGHSLLATRVVSRAREAFGVEVPLGTLFEAPTVGELAAQVDGLLREDAGVPAPPIVPVPRDGELPLSFAQQRLWFIDQLQPGSAAYNIPTAQRVRGPLDVAALERALGELLRRHEALRTVFASVGGRAVQVVRPAEGFALPVFDLSARPAAEREDELLRLAREDEAAPFDLRAGPLLRARLVKLGDEEHALLLNMHHIVSDGWSVDVMIREVAALYGAFRAGHPSPLPELPVQYADFAAWQRAWLSGEVLERQLAWWRAQLAGAPPVLEMPTDRPRPRVSGTEGGHRPLHLPRETALALRALSRREGATLYMTLMAAWQALLGRHAGQDDVPVGMPIAGRTRAETEGLIGFFVNTLVIRTDLSGSPDARELVRRVRGTTLGAFQHQDVPFEKLVEELGVERSLGHTPLYQAVLSLRNEGGAGPRLAGAELEPVATGGAVAKFDLSLAFTDDGEDLSAGLAYRTDLFDAGTAERLLEHFALLLRGMAASPEVPVSELPLMEEWERHRVLTEWNATGRAAPTDRCVHELFEAEAALRPEATALVFGDRVLTYAELDARADRLARHLRGLGVEPETAVGVCLERSAEMVVGLLGILKAGGAYVPLDPAYPADRVAFMLEDSGAPVLLTQAGLAERFGGFAGEVVLVGPPHPPGPPPPASEGRGENDSTKPAVLPSPTRGGGAGGGGLSPANAAYVIYTSGSTGRPKGVRVEHRALANLLWSAREAFGVRPGDVMPCVSSFAFDIWLFEALVPLVSGGVTRVLPRERALDPAAFAEELGRVTMFNAVTPLMAEVVREVRASGAGTVPGIRGAFVGGEAVAPDLVAEMRAAFPNAELRVLYGPTEGTVLASSWRAPGAPGERAWRELERAAAQAVPDDARCIHHLFEAEARRAPDAVAVSFRNERVSYAELDARANRLARHLRALGVGPEVRVGVCLERTPELVVALLATLKAGGAYIPLDPVYPADRQRFMLEDADARVLVTQARLAAGLDRPGMEVVRVDADRERIAAEAAEAPESGVQPDNLAYVIYTSGSTGRPKGVAIQHRSAVVMLRWLREQIDPEDRAAVLGSTSVSFDVSIAEIFGTLSWGGKLVLVGNALDLANLPAGEEVRVASMVPSAAAELLRTGGIPAGVRVMNLGGEALPDDLAQALYALGTVRSVGNLYGPSEDTTYTTYSVVGRGEQVLIGRPIANTQAYVLDDDLQPVPIGVAGELYLAGAGLARGYQGRPDMTADRFVPNPFSVEPGRRMYRTGDRIRWRPDGNLEYMGRFDHQVKVRGFRIEPGEIEVVLRAHPGVRDAVVIVREDTPGDRRLVAYLTPGGEAPVPPVGELRNHLRERLPEHMVPGAFVPLETIPMTPNGKVDRKALPVPGGRPAGSEEYVAPRTPTEEALAAVWAEVLGIERVGAGDNFFELGGHSLLLVQLHARLKETLGLQLSVADLFQFASLADLARHLDESREAEDAAAPSREETLSRADTRRSRLGRQRAARGSTGSRPQEEDEDEDE